MLGNLYFIQEDVDGCIKIGWTSADPQIRVRTFQVGNSNELRLLGSIKAPADAETGWHERFADVCRRSEWFYPVAGLLEAIEKAATAPPPKVEDFVWTGPEATGEDVLAWMQANNIGLADMAERLDYTIAHFALSLERSSWGMSPRMAYRIEKVTDGAIKAEALLVPFRTRKLRDAQEAEAQAERQRKQTAEYIASGQLAKDLARGQ